VTDDRQTFGWGLRLDDGDLVLTGGELEQVSGLANLRQGLVLRLRTPLAADRLNVAYGLDVAAALTGPLDRRLTKELLRLAVIRTLAGDPRVAEVTDVLFDDDPAFLDRHPGSTAPPASRRTAVAEVTVRPAASGAPVTLFADVSW
jgi:hypothetical protein